MLTGHDIPRALLADVERQLGEFFHQPAAVKNSIRRTARNSWGFYDAEITKNRKDWKEILDIGATAHDGPLQGSSPQWPDIPQFKSVFTDLTERFHELALHLTDSIAALIDPQRSVRCAFDSDSSFLRLNYYPPCAQAAVQDSQLVAEDGHLGISHHTDAGALTVLWQTTQPALQVWHDHRWQLVTPPADALIINIGDIIQVWSNDIYRAPVHRVLAHARQERFSVPYFLNPHYDYVYAPLNNTEQPRYQPINWGEFRSRRSAGDYADQGAEVQISDYRTHISA